MTKPTAAPSSRPLLHPRKDDKMSYGSLVWWLDDGIVRIGTVTGHPRSGGLRVEEDGGDYPGVTLPFESLHLRTMRTRRHEEYLISVRERYIPLFLLRLECGQSLNGIAPDNSRELFRVCLSSLLPHHTLEWCDDPHPVKSYLAPGERPLWLKVEPQGLCGRGSCKAWRDYDGMFWFRDADEDVALSSDPVEAAKRTALEALRVLSEGV